jgi:cellobiose phosphorylase
MPRSVPSDPIFPFTAASPAGTAFQLNSNGSMRRMDCGEILINLFPGNEAEGGPANIHLRRHGAVVEGIPLTGPCSPAAWCFDERGMTGHGRWGDLVFRIRLMLAESAPAWFWHVELQNTGVETVKCDLIHTQDIGIAHYGAVRLNEHYVSQYIDHSPLEHPSKGAAIASRQNQSMGGRYPWTVIGSLGKGVSHATDALQFLGLASRAGDEPAALTTGLPGSRLQHEHSLVCIQDEIIELQAGHKSTRGFFAWFEADHPAATSVADLRLIDAALALPEAVCPPWPGDPIHTREAGGCFATAPWFVSCDLTDDEARGLFGCNVLHEETMNGRLLSFFTPAGGHVVLKAKEIEVLRPHGHILRTGGTLVPDEAALTSTAWMGGVFHSMVTQGHVSINRFLSTCHSYLGMFRSHGQRVFVEIDGTWRLLGIPSAFAMNADSCRWIYKHAGGMIEVAAAAAEIIHELRLSLKVTSGNPVRFLVSHHVAMNGDDGLRSGPVVFEKNGNAVRVRAVPDSDVGRRFPDGCFVIEPDAGTVIEAIGGDDMLYQDGRSRNEPFLCFMTAPSLSAGLSIRGNLVDAELPQSAGFWQSIAGTLAITAPAAGTPAMAARRIAAIFPWFVHNALVHYLSPRGLEQYSGGGWGTRDVCQGPLELLLALGRFDSVRDLLCRVFRQQNPDGDWPQWFMFFERERGIRPGDSHGDIVYWPVLALAQYLDATGDASLLDETLPFFQGDGDGETTTVLAHVDRALELIRRRVIQGTVLAAYGHGDWNDSLQPAKPEMRDQLCSSWTVTLNYQTFITLADAFRKIGHVPRAVELETEAAAVLEAFQHNLIVDEVIAGLVYFHPDGNAEPLLHPRDRSTGLSYSLLPMIHAVINDMLTPEQAGRHLALIREHLLGPDGAHLFDRPMAYHGGIQTNFQRAESASYFGREIGIMYTHAHIRYAEALARHGDPAAFYHALCLINPIAMRELVPSAAPRQANCYYSSSDPAFADRYQAFSEYDKVKRGEVPLEGGWRVYSSGPGIAVRLMMHCFLGLRVEKEALVVDPCVPPDLDGLTAIVNLTGRPIEVLYRTGNSGCGPVSVELNGTPLEFSRLTNRYRLAGVRIPMDAWTGRLRECGNRLVITLA